MSGSLHSPNVSISSSNHPGITVPLLSLAPPALALGDDLTLGQLGAEHNAGDIWNGESFASSLSIDANVGCSHKSSFGFGERWEKTGKPSMAVRSLP